MEDNPLLTTTTAPVQEEEKLVVPISTEDDPELRLNVRIAASLRRRLKAEAALRDLTMSEVIRELVEGYLGVSEYPTPKPGGTDAQ